MNCSECDDNYLRKIFKSCMDDCDMASEALLKFDKIVSKSRDPRNPLTVITAIYSNNCDDCKKHRCYYEEYLKRINEEGQ